MLVLSRKKDETIVIREKGREPIFITIVKIDNRNKVRLGIEANKGVTILRSELENNEEATIPKIAAPIKQKRP